MAGARTRRAARAMRKEFMMACEGQLGGGIRELAGGRRAAGGRDRILVMGLAKMELGLAEF